jgi:hypothetical protein
MAIETFIKDLGRRFEARMVQKLRRLGPKLLARTKEQVGFTDHSLKDLADLDHPYARRLTKNSGPHPDNVVHKQSGGFIKSLAVKSFRARQSLGLDLITKDQDRLEFFDWGTQTMRARPFWDPVADEMGDELLEEACEALEKAICDVTI